MSAKSLNLIRTYLEDLIAAEASFESQLRTFGTNGDDQEVQAVFAAHAEQTRSQQDRLTTRLHELGGEPSTGKSMVAHLFALAPRTAQIAHLPEERAVQDLIVGYTVETSECAMYEGLATVAAATGDDTTARLAREIQSEEAHAAEKMWHFIRTRSIIAYNMLTIAEIDPAVETKVGEASWTS